MTDNAKPDQRRLTGRMLPVLVILLVAVVGLFTLRDFLSFETLSQHHEMLTGIRDSNYLLAVVLFVAGYALIVGFSLPGATIATLTGGFLFGTFPGVVFNVVGATIGATAIFLAVKWGFGDRLAKQMDLNSGPVQRVKAGIDNNQWSMLFLIRLIPVVPFFVANLLPAVFGVPTGRYVVSTLIGIIPGGLVYTAVGAGLSDVIARGESPDLGVIFEPQILLPILGLCLLALLPIMLRNSSRKSG